MKIDVGPPFKAKWHGECPYCGKPWWPDMKVAYVDGVVSCLECLDAAMQANLWNELDEDAE